MALHGHAHSTCCGKSSAHGPPGSCIYYACWVETNCKLLFFFFWNKFPKDSAFSPAIQEKMKRIQRGAKYFSGAVGTARAARVAWLHGLQLSLSHGTEGGGGTHLNSPRICSHVWGPVGSEKCELQSICLLTRWEVRIHDITPTHLPTSEGKLMCALDCGPKIKPQLFLATWQRHPDFHLKSPVLISCHWSTDYRGLRRSGVFRGKNGAEVLLLLHSNYIIIIIDFNRYYSYDSQCCTTHTLHPTAEGWCLYFSFFPDLWFMYLSWTAADLLLV